jgi:hypothetical protein
MLRRMGQSVISKKVMMMEKIFGSYKMHLKWTVSKRGWLKRLKNKREPNQLEKWRLCSWVSINYPMS